MWFWGVLVLWCSAVSDMVFLVDGRGMGWEWELDGIV